MVLKCKGPGKGFCKTNIKQARKLSFLFIGSSRLTSSAAVPANIHDVKSKTCACFYVSLQKYPGKWGPAIKAVTTMDSNCFAKSSPCFLWEIFNPCCFFFPTCQNRSRLWGTFPVSMVSLSHVPMGRNTSTGLRLSTKPWPVWAFLNTSASTVFNRHKRDLKIGVLTCSPCKKKLFECCWL